MAATSTTEPKPTPSAKAAFKTSIPTRSRRHQKMPALGLLQEARSLGRLRTHLRRQKCHRIGSSTGKLRDRPEIDRHRLRKILLARVPEGNIKWGHRPKQITQDGGCLLFDGHSQPEGPFDLIVGADGGWSKVCARLTNTKPQYSGVSGYELRLPNPSIRCPNLNKMVGSGAYFSSSDQKKNSSTPNVWLTEVLRSDLGTSAPNLKHGNHWTATAK